MNHLCEGGLLSGKRRVPCGRRPPTYYLDSTRISMNESWEYRSFGGEAGLEDVNNDNIPILVIYRTA